MAKGKLKGRSLENAMPSEPDKDYQTEDDVRVMHQAAAIAADEERLARVHKLAGRRHKALKGMISPMMKGEIKTLADLKKRAGAKMDDDMMEDED
jgi:hypothetical protein